MSNPTILFSGTTFTFADGDCENVKSIKTAGIDPNPTPASDSDQAFIVDFHGVLRSITISGFITPAFSTRIDTGSVATIKEQLDWLDAIPNGAQTGVTLNTTYLVNKIVYIRRFEHDEKSGDALRVAFTMELLEGL